MSKFTVKLEGEELFRRALRRFPRELKSRSVRLMKHLENEYTKYLTRNHWEIGQRSGGIPEDTGSLINDGLKNRTTPTRMEQYIRDSKAEAYGWYVHEGTNKMQERPFFNSAQKALESKRRLMTDKYLQDLIDKLAK